MKNKIMPLHIQSMYIYLLKYGLTVEEVYFNIYNDAPLTSSKIIWRKTHQSNPFPMARTIDQAFHQVLVHALLKPQVIDNVDLPMGELKKDIATLIAEHSTTIPLSKRLLKMRIGYMICTVTNIIWKGLTNGKTKHGTHDRA